MKLRKKTHDALYLVGRVLDQNIMPSNPVNVAAISQTIRRMDDLHRKANAVVRAILSRDHADYSPDELTFAVDELSQALEK